MKKTRPSASMCRLLAAIAGTVAFAMPSAANAGEGGTTHVIPGAMSTLADNAPASGPGMFVKPMYMRYDGSVTALIPTAAGLAGNADVSTNTFGLIAGHTFGTEVLGGATWTMVTALPYIWLDITADLDAPKSPSALLDSSVTLDEVQGKMNEQHPPAYVSSVKYGRMIVFTFESAYSSTELGAALDFAYSGGVDVKGDVSVTYKDIISSSKITLHPVLPSIRKSLGPKNFLP